jgi:hypothetical protein
MAPLLSISTASFTRMDTVGVVKLLTAIFSSVISAMDRSRCRCVGILRTRLHGGWRSWRNGFRVEEDILSPVDPDPTVWADLQLTESFHDILLCANVFEHPET